MAHNFHPSTGSDDEMKRLRSIIRVAGRTISAQNKEIRDTNQELQDKNRKLEAFADKVKDHVLCPICFEEFTKPVVVVCCGQTLCEDCMLQSMHHSMNQSMLGTISCPMCRTNNMVYVGNIVVEDISQSMTTVPCLANNFDGHLLTNNNDKTSIDTTATDDEMKHLRSEIVARLNQVDRNNTKLRVIIGKGNTEISRLNTELRKIKKENKKKNTEIRDIKQELQDKNRKLVTTNEMNMNNLDVFTVIGVFINNLDVFIAIGLLIFVTLRWTLWSRIPPPGRPKGGAATQQSAQ